MRRAYEGTKTPVMRSQEHIRMILAKYGAQSVEFQERWGENEKVGVRFLFTIEKVSYIVRIVTPVPEIKESGRRQDVRARLKEPARRQTWRAIFWAIKSRMEAVQFGIETFQEAFLAHFEIPGENGVTIGDRLVPQLMSGRLALPSAETKGGSA